MDNSDLLKAFGRMEAQLEEQGRELGALKKDMRDVRDALVKVRGGRMFLAGLIAAGTVLGTIVSWFGKYAIFTKL